MEPNLDDQIKAAERDKLIAETEKARSEKQKIELECENLKKEKNKPWLQKYFGGLLGIGFLGFFITFVIYPMSTIENKELLLKTKIDAEKLHANEVKFKEDSLIFINYTDSIRAELNSRLQFIENLKQSRDLLELGYQNLIKTYKNENSKKIAEATKKLTELKKAYDAQQKYLSEEKVIKKGSVQINFVDPDGSPITAEHLDITFFNIEGAIMGHTMINGEISVTAELPVGKYVGIFKSGSYYKTSIDFEITHGKLLTSVALGRILDLH